MAAVAEAPRAPSPWQYADTMSSATGTEYRNLLVTTGAPTARIVLNRPDKRNALSLELMEELTAALRDCAAAPRRARS